MTSPPSSPVLVPGWLDRLAALGWRILATAGLAVVLALVAAGLSTVTASIVVALLAVFAMLPINSRLRAGGASSPVSAGIATGLGAAAVVAVLLLLVIAFLPHLAAVVSAVREGLADLRASIDGSGLPEWAIEGLEAVIDSIVGALTVNVAELASPVATAVTVAILAGFLTYFLLADGADGWAWAMRSLQPWQAEAVTDAASRASTRVSGYLGRTAILAAVDGIVVFAVLVAVGVGIAGPLAAIAFIGGFIPFLGALFATTAVALAALALAGPGAAAAVVVGVIVTSIVMGRVLARTRFGPEVDVNAMLVLVAIPAGLALFGPLGLFALLPTVVFLAAVGKSIVLALGLAPAHASARADGIVPVWLDRLAQWSWRGLVIVGLLWLIVQLVIRLPYVAIPLVLGAVFAATLAPVARWFRGLGWSPGLASAMTTFTAVVVTAVAVAASIAYSIGPMREIVATAIEGADDLGVGLIEGVARTVGGDVLADIARFLRSIAVAVVMLVLTLLLTFFLLRDADRLWQGVVSRVVPVRRERVAGIGSETVRILSGYMVGTAIISAFGAVTTSAILILLGLPLALPIGVFSFAAGFIPYIGSFLSTALSTLVAVAVGQPIDVVVMLIWTVVFNIVQGNFVTPLVYGRTMSLHPAIVLLAIPAGGQVAGILGMFLIVPFVAIFAAVLGPVLALIADPGPLTSDELPGRPPEHGRPLAGAS
jgi:predicted PurR-regulated permease PerM